MRGVIIAILGCFLAQSCVELSTYSDLRDFENYQWTTDENATFSFSPISTSQSGDIAIALRHLNTMKDTSLQLYIKTSKPLCGVYYTDTISVDLTRYEGSRIRTTTIPYRKGVVWQSIEKHGLSISCNKDLTDIMSISVEIDNATRN